MWDVMVSNCITEDRSLSAAVGLSNVGGIWSLIAWGETQWKVSRRWETESGSRNVFFNVTMPCAGGSAILFLLRSGWLRVKYPNIMNVQSLQHFLPNRSHRPYFGRSIQDSIFCLVCLDPKLRISRLALPICGRVIALTSRSLQDGNRQFWIDILGYVTILRR